jgi:hypothetical protein
MPWCSLLVAGSGPYMRVLWWTKWRRDRFRSEFVGFLLSISFHRGSSLSFISSGGWTIGPLLAAVQRHSVTPWTWTLRTYRETDIFLASQQPFIAIRISLPCSQERVTRHVHRRSSALVRFKVLAAASMMLRIVFWDVLHHPWWWRQYAPLKRRSTIILHCSTSQKTILNICTRFIDLNDNLRIMRNPNMWAFQPWVQV